MTEWVKPYWLFGAGLVASVVLTYIVLALARFFGWRSQTREDAPERHQRKQGTPSLGGLAPIGAILVLGIVMMHLAGDYDWPVLAILWLTAVFALLGLIDDVWKVQQASTVGIPARYRLAAQAVVALGFAWFVADGIPACQSEALGFGSLPVAARVIIGLLVVVASANAVNLSDGLDGLAPGLLVICGAAVAVICWIVGAAQLAALSALAVGAAAGFLWLNSHPAQIFMGDVGSVGMGALLGGIAVAGGIELVFAVAALVFVAETLSVIVQVLWFRRAGRRVFAMTPIHHAFELRGWAEPQIVVRFWLVGLVVATAAVVWTAHLG